jgi:Zn-dependent protease
VALMEIDIVLFAFNLIPLPPLDGSKFLLLALQGPQHARTRWWIETRGPNALILAIVVDAFVLHSLVFGTIIGVCRALAFSLIGL